MAEKVIIGHLAQGKLAKKASDAVEHPNVNSNVAVGVYLILNRRSFYPGI